MRFILANRIAPDGTPRLAVSHLVLLCLPMSHKKVVRLIWVNTFIQFMLEKSKTPVISFMFIHVCRKTFEILFDMSCVMRNHFSPFSIALFASYDLRTIHRLMLVNTCVSMKFYEDTLKDFSYRAQGSRYKIYNQFQRVITPKLCSQEIQFLRFTMVYSHVYKNKNHEDILNGLRVHIDMTTSKTIIFNFKGQKLQNTWLLHAANYLMLVNICM